MKFYEMKYKQFFINIKKKINYISSEIIVKKQFL